MKTRLLIVAVGSLVIGLLVGYLGSSRFPGRAAVKPLPPSPDFSAAEYGAPAVRNQTAKSEVAPQRDFEVAVPRPRTFEAILNELSAIRVTPGPAMGRAQYRVLALLDELAQGGPAALPSIRGFLASGRDTAYGGGWRGQTAILPPSLRFGLFDVVRQIGGPGAEQIMAENLGTTSGSEFSYLAQLLEETAPGKYADTILSSARALLSAGKLADASAKDAVYEVLRAYKDTSFVTTAQANLIQNDGKVDRSALKYLQNAIGSASLSVAAQAYQDQRVADAESKEALGRLALTFVGADDKALELYHKAALDPQLTQGQRRNLIEDLNEDGLVNKRTPTPEDVKVIANRYALTQTYLQQDYVKNDKLLSEAFAEADKDLRNLLQRAGALPATAATTGR